MTGARNGSAPPSAPSSHDPLRRWDAAGLAALAVIVLTIPLAYAKFRLTRRPQPPAAKATFVGRASCAECHKQATERWTGSYHALAMDVANEKTVRGNFNDATFEYFGIVSRFYREKGKYLVYTEGPDGKMADYEVTHVFGVYPLQQYLIPFPGGRLQALSIAWDDVGKRWYHLYPNERILPGDWLHWTRGAQNWNGMCSECHSTNVHKGYDPATDSYTTTYSEIDVSCEACHGPASLHVEWARLPAMARPAAEDYRLVISTKGMSAREQVELCAPCHSRRFYLRDYAHEPGTDLLDHLVPSTLAEHLYFPDGQIQDEVYEYSSFVQSKMYRHNVRCTDCHDAHSTKRHKDGNALCLQCHKGDVYNTTAHHFHKETYDGKPSPGFLCVKCHMPERVYMGVDWRADHSIRIPRPDLSLTLGVPNACSQQGCHADKPVKWSADAYSRWYGLARRPHYGTVIAAAREGKPEALNGLLNLVQDRLYAAMVRATAVSLLDRYPGPEARDALAKALQDEESIVRRAALDQGSLLLPDERERLVAPLLRDPVEGVRTQAALVLAENPGHAPAAAHAQAVGDALAEYERAMHYQLDFASAGYNLGNLYTALGRYDEAESNYRASIRIDPLFVRTRVNYALLLNGLRRNADAEAQLRAALAAQPELPEALYNLGLLLAEMNRLPEAVSQLEHAARLMPEHARLRYNLGLAYQQLGRYAEAGATLRRAVALDPENADFTFALADFLARRGALGEARKIATAWVVRHPDDPRAVQLLAALGGAAPPTPGR